ncbi:MAG: Ig-like domain-containing protein [Granulosicoccus sp.]
MEDTLRSVVVAGSMFATLSVCGGASADIFVTGNVISWPDDSWHQVQVQSTYESICESARYCLVPDGVYTVINHDTGKRYPGVRVPQRPPPLLMSSAASVGGGDDSRVLSDSPVVPGLPELTSPAPGARLPGESVTFVWAANGADVERWFLRLGTSPGSGDIAEVGIRNAASTQHTIHGLPTDGRTEIFLEFSYWQNGEWVRKLERFVAFDGVQASGNADSLNMQNNTISVLAPQSPDTANKAPQAQAPQAQAPLAQAPFIPVIERNRAPVATDDIIGPVVYGQAIVIPVTSNDTDADGSILPASVNIETNPRHGTASVDANGRITYRHSGTPGASADSFSYTIMDNNGQVSNSATVTLTLIAEPSSLTTAMYSPLDITYDNPDWSGNPFDLLATATFTHTVSGAQRKAEFFFNGDRRWTVRFVADQTGIWRFTTASNDADLNNHSGTVAVTDSAHEGFVVGRGDKWTFSASGRAFVPQYVMAASLKRFARDPGKISRDLNTFVGEHGFTGFHIRGYCHWFKVEHDRCSNIAANERDPDLRTFEVIERIIQETSARGGATHIWMYGDNSRVQNPGRWGFNGVADQRLQRYLAARLGALPGWTIGYGYDVFEWATRGQIDTWFNYLQDRMMYPHLAGARANKNEIMQLTETVTYSAYEQHRASYADYRRAIQDRPSKPSFSEDRFRVDEQYPDKDYTFGQTRRGMWHSTMAGGVANIWGNLQFDEGGSYDEGSRVYPNSDQLKIYADFIVPRFRSDFQVCNELTDGLCLRNPGHSRYLFYKENASSVSLDLKNISGSASFLAMDTQTGTTRRGVLQAGQHTWSAPYRSDWVIDVR